jgi:hypothetical protein
VAGAGGAAVELAVRSHGERVQDDNRGRDHVLGERGGEVGADLGWVRLVAGGDEVADESFVAGGVLADDHGSGGDGRVGRELGLDLARLETEATQLDLIVATTQILQRAVRIPANDISRAAE